MQYVRSLGGSVSKTWNSINPATLSGAIDVIVVEQEDGSLACSPFHVRFGKFSLLRPYEKKVEFKVNDSKQDFAMKLGEGGEAFFVFETSDEIPESLQTSPVISPATSPQSLSSTAVDDSSTYLQEPEFLDLNTDDNRKRRVSASNAGSRPSLSAVTRARSDFGGLTSNLVIPGPATTYSIDEGWHTSDPIPVRRSSSEEVLPILGHSITLMRDDSTIDQSVHPPELSSTLPNFIDPATNGRSVSPPPVTAVDAVIRAKSLSQKLSGSNIPTKVTDCGDLMLDMTGYKSSEEEAIRAEVVARKILAEELEGNYDIGALIGADEHGNLWIYSSEEAKEAASQRIGARGLLSRPVINDAASDPGHHSDDENLSPAPQAAGKHQRTQSDTPTISVETTPLGLPADSPSNTEISKNYAKTLRLTSEQLKTLRLRPGANTMSFSVNRATCQASMYYWKFDVPIVISDIDGTITKSDALGHVLNMIGRDWTHAGVAKLYTDIVANGYNIFYLTSRSVGQADTTRTYLSGVYQDGYRLPKGPVILSPDRTIAALRREIYLRKPEVFKMACLRDIMNLFKEKSSPFYAGFGNRLTDALSYRSVNIPSTRIFTINSNAEVSLDLLTLNKYKSSYVTMREVVDHFFPPVGLLVAGGGDDYTDFNFWRDTPVEIDDSSDGSIIVYHTRNNDKSSLRSEDEGSDGYDDEDVEADMAESYLSRESTVEGGDLVNSILESIDSGDSKLDGFIADEGDQGIAEAIASVAIVSPDGEQKDGSNQIQDVDVQLTMVSKS